MIILPLIANKLQRSLLLFVDSCKFMSVLIIVISLLNHCHCDIYSGDRRDPYLTARPSIVDNYAQWGHYPILYQNPNRPLENVNKYDPRYSAVAPDTFNRYKI